MRRQRKITASAIVRNVTVPPSPTHEFQNALPKPDGLRAPAPSLFGPSLPTVGSSNRPPSAWQIFVIGNYGSNFRAIAQINRETAPPVAKRYRYS